MDLKLVKDFNPWWHNTVWSAGDFHLVSLEGQKIKWEYKLMNNFDQGIYSLRGPRQVGKTTWIKQEIKKILKNSCPRNVLFYSCDNLKKNDLIELILFFLDNSEEGKRYIFLDEIPFVEEWELAIKQLYDLGKLKNTFVLVSGSNSLDIKKSTEKLPGRGDAGKRHFVMQPLTFLEYLKATNLEVKLTDSRQKNEAELKLFTRELAKHFNNYLLTGGFLKIINEYHEKKEINDSSYEVYLKWVIGDLSKYNFKEKYAKQLLRRIIETYTSEVSWSSLASKTDIDTHNTAARYADALEEMFIINVIYKLDFNKKIADYPKAKKIYFSDPFLLGACLKWVNSYEGNFAKHKEFVENNVSKICEGVFLNHLVRLLTKKTSSNVFHYSDVVHYWNNKTKTKEIDFVYQKNAFELKYQNDIKKSDYAELKNFEKWYLITKDIFDKNTYPIPAFLCLLEQNSLLDK